MADTIRCLMVRESNAGAEPPRKTDWQAESVHQTELARPLEQESGEQVQIAIRWSSLNYKDALALHGHPGVAKQLPLIPGIDAAGVVLHSDSDRFQPGDEVLVFHARLGTERHGAYAEQLFVPADWVYPLPSGLTLREAMILGTAGFTAAQCVQELLRHDIQPGSGEIVVSGATGGVGIFAVKLLSQLGFEVVASTGKADRTDWLKEQGAREVLDRAALHDTSGRPLLGSRWAGAVDTVGGETLATILRATRGFGCVTACGLAASDRLEMTVYPFILRGITLQGVDTANIPTARRAGLWDRLAGPWKPTGLEELATEVDLNGLPAEAERILAGQVAGRVIVRVGDHA